MADGAVLPATKIKVRNFLVMAAPTSAKVGLPVLQPTPGTFFAATEAGRSMNNGARFWL